MARGPLELFACRDELHRRPAGAEQLTCVDLRAGPEQVEEHVGGELLRCARVELDRVGRRTLGGVDEARAAALGRGGARVEVDDVRRGLRIEQPAQPRHAVGLRDDAQRALGDAVPFTVGDAGFVEFVAQLSCAPVETVGIHRGRVARLLAEHLSGRAQRLARDAVARLSQPAPYRLDVLRPERAGGDRVGDGTHPGGRRRDQLTRAGVRQPRRIVERGSRAHGGSRVARGCAGVRAEELLGRAVAHALRETLVPEGGSRAAGDLAGDEGAMAGDRSLDLGEHARRCEQIVVVGLAIGGDLGTEPAQRRELRPQGFEVFEIGHASMISNSNTRS